MESSAPSVGLFKVRNEPYLLASCSVHVVSHAEVTESQEWVIPAMKQSFVTGAATPAGRCHTWMRSPISRPRTCGHRLTGSAWGSTCSDVNRSSPPLDTYSTHCAHISVVASSCRIRSERA